jgi:2-polyprenyl-3-methyl-5-hydroxy-6-metoxy-1,4-benzoquinol methylase
MDRPQPVSAELEKDLQNLVALNRYFGSHRIVRHFLSRWLVEDRSYRVLDLATGSGDIPRLIVDWARQQGLTVQVDAVDANSATLEIARQHSAGYPEITFLRGDARHFESSESYDLVCCSLALHHFTEEDAVRVLRCCRGLSHRYTLVTDLERSWSTTAGVWAVTQFLFREPMTRYDGRVSAERAFSFAEMRALAEAAGWQDFCHARFLFCRQALWLDQEDLAGAAEVALAAADPLPTPA